MQSSTTGLPAEPPRPEQHLMQLLMGKMISKAVSVVADLGVPDHLGSEPVPVDVLARSTGTHPDALYRLLRALAGVGLFVETADRAFLLSPTGRLLRRDTPQSFAAFARWINEDSSWAAWGRLDDAVRTGKASFETVHGTQVFEYFAQHPETAAIFNSAMTGMSAMTADAVARSYDFSGCRRLVDVGGGHGALLATILGRYPRLEGVLFDLPQVVEGARAQLDAAGLVGRVDVASGSFFDGVPPGADVYLMKAIIHDWDDDHGARILANCREAMAPGGRVLVVETLVADHPEALLSKLIDLEMLVMTSGGRERTEPEFAALFRRAGLELRRVVRTPSPAVVLEASVR